MGLDEFDGAAKVYTVGLVSTYELARLLPGGREDVIGEMPKLLCSLVACYVAAGFAAGLALGAAASAAWCMFS